MYNGSGKALHRSGAGSGLVARAVNVSCLVGLALVSTSGNAFAQFSRFAETFTPDGTYGDRYGFSVSLSGTTMAVGAPDKDGHGVVYVYVRNGSAWVLQATISPMDSSAGQNFGTRVALGSGGNLLAISAPFRNNQSGAVEVWSRVSGMWNYRNTIKAPETVAGDVFGFGLSIAPSGATIVVGAPYHVSAGATVGAAYVFTWSSASPGLVPYKKKLPQPDPQHRHLFGDSVAINAAKVIVVGAPSDIDPGSAYVFVPGTTWTFSAKLSASDNNTPVIDAFGISVGIGGSGNTTRIAVGAPNRSSPAGTNTGAVYAYSLFGEEEIEVVDDAVDGEQLGRTVAISQDGTRVAAWAPAYRDYEGKVYLFDFAGSGTIKLTARDRQAKANFGRGISIYSNILAVGANYPNLNEPGRVYTTP